MYTLYMGLECAHRWIVEYKPVEIRRSSRDFIIFMPNFKEKYGSILSQKMIGITFHSHKQLAHNMLKCVHQSIEVFV